MITKEELAGYLPYGLGFQIEQFEQISTIKMEGLTTDNGTVVVWGDNKSGYGKAFNKKPLLRPLSSLTTEQEINGEMVVPLVELAKISFPDWNWNNARSININLNLEIVECDFPHVPEYVFGNVWETLDFYGSEGSNTIIPRNQLQLFQWLYKNHFDLHNLIERNLALNLLEYKTR